jgi:S-adenosylmethionine synthetase
MNDSYMFTSESVTAGHPDKLCDQISDAIVGRVLRQDPLARVISECAVSTGIVFVSVKLAANAAIDVARSAREVIGAAGYNGEEFNAATCTVMTSMSEAAPAEGRIDERTLDEDALDTVTAHDQVTLFGYACRQTPAWLPLPVWLSRKLARRLAGVREPDDHDYLTPDGKTQVGVEFRGRVPQRIHSVTVVAGVRPGGAVPPGRLREELAAQVIDAAFADEPIRPDERTRISINPNDALVPWGPATHAGLTGRKTADDTYGEYARHSGAALSGKDPSRIDRIGAYAARHAALNVVAAGLADECEVMLSYSIGLARPVSIEIQTFGTHHIAERELAERVRRTFDFRPAAIVRRFALRDLPQRHPDGFYARLAAYGHVGRPELQLPWENTSAAAALG